MAADEKFDYDKFLALSDKEKEAAVVAEAEKNAAAFKARDDFKRELVEKDPTAKVDVPDEFEAQVEATPAPATPAKADNKKKGDD